MPRPEIVPDAKVMHAVRDQVVAEIIERLTLELGHAIALIISTYCESKRLADLGMLESRGKGQGEAQRGEVRLRFRPTGDPNLFRFLADGHLEHDQRNPTYSGFIVEGHVTRDESTGEDAAEFSTWAVKHNDPGWAYW